MSDWIYQVLPEESDRRLLRDRLVKKLAGLRRGRLYLPRHFPSEVKALASMSIGESTRLAFQLFTIGKQSDPVLSKSWVEYIHRVLPGGCIRTVHGDFSVHKWHSEHVSRLRKSDWPRLGTRRAWPSTPTLIESMEMACRGSTPRAFYRPQPVKNRVSLAEYNSNVALRAKLIGQQIVGIRSDVKVPKDFLRHFRYRWNFLILVTPYKISAALVRFLTSQWIRNPHSLWLREKVYFRSYLKGYSPIRSIPGPW
jgi:hypothetical protein